jgi:Transposase DDE domain.
VFDHFSSQGIFFVTRLKSNAVYEAIKENDIGDDVDQGVIKDEIISVEVKKEGKPIKNMELRRIVYWDDEHKRCFEFITNLKEMDAGHIALIYKKRWQIELLFKQLKQNFPLKYFWAIMRMPLKSRYGAHSL